MASIASGDRVGSVLTSPRREHFAWSHPPLASGSAGGGGRGGDLMETSPAMAASHSAISPTVVRYGEVRRGKRGRVADFSPHLAQRTVADFSPPLLDSGSAGCRVLCLDAVSRREVLLGGVEGESD